jgi:Leucine rich repeat/BspA type Leucine rich repeat region (6 copies)
LFAIALIKTTTAAVSCDFSYYNKNAGELQCTMSSTRMLSENEDLPALDYEDYRPYLTYLFGSGSTVSYIPIGFFTRFYNVRTVYLGNAGLKEVTRNSFRFGYKILEINLYNNQLNSIPADAFADCSRLVLLYLEHNQLTTFDVQPGIPMLQELVLRYNRINAINQEIFVKLPDLKRLALVGNQCVSRDFLKDTRVYGSQTLEGISRNELVTCSFNWKNTVTTTQRPPSDLTPSARECKYSVTQNGYTCVFARVSFMNDYSDNFQVSGTHLAGKSDNDVTSVSFLKSKLVKVPAVIFKKFPNLSHLDIASAGIVTADSSTIENCGTLKHLDASDNDITRITESFLNSCRNLETVNLDWNAITSISPCNSFLKHQPYLRSVSLEYNSCVEQSFSDLNLSANFAKVLERPLRFCFINFILGNDAPVAIKKRRFLPEEKEVTEQELPIDTETSEQ